MLSLVILSDGSFVRKRATVHVDRGRKEEFVMLLAWIEDGKKNSCSCSRRSRKERHFSSSLLDQRVEVLVCVLGPYLRALVAPRGLRPHACADHQIDRLLRLHHRSTCWVLLLLIGIRWNRTRVIESMKAGADQVYCTARLVATASVHLIE